MATTGISRTRLSEGASHESFLRHRNFRWLKIAAALSALFLLLYLLTDVEPRHNGGSWYGYVLGTIGALLILWLTLLGVRKRAMTRGRWSLKAWTSAHVYLGLALLVVATLHTGFQFGWNVHTLAYALMLLVIASGGYGIAVYALLPTGLSDNRCEMTRSQMVEAVAKLDAQLHIAAQPLAGGDARLVSASAAESAFAGGVVRRLSGRYPRCGTAEALRLLRRRHAASAGPEADSVGEVLKLLERKSEALARIRRHLRLRAMLEVWLFVHVPVTFALLAALAAHIVSVFFYR